VLKVLLKKIHKDPFNVPQKPFKEALEKCPPNYGIQTQKSRRVMISKKPLNMLGTPKCEGQKPPLSLPETKQN
jgi:hypothetical protein